jgi:nucleoside-diphosphate-sugar epimerase
MKILITGAGGFIGQYLAKNLRDHTVDALCRADLDVRNETMLNQQVRDHGYDWVINCAAAGCDRVKDHDSMIFQDNIVIFSNLVSIQDRVKGIINFGSGAEFDITKDITLAKENDIWHRSPEHSYGLSKNVISRLASACARIHTLRLFGCFDASEDDSRPIKRLRHAAQHHQRFVIEQDRWFDWISAEDMLQVVQRVLDEPRTPNDINLVYTNKTRLSDFFRLYCVTQGFETDCIEVKHNNGLDYTGDSARIDSLELPLLGLEKSLQHYGRS